MRNCNKLLCLLLTLLLLLGTASAAEPEDRFEGKTLPEIMEDFLAEKGLTEETFSMSFYNTVTGESYAYNDEKFQLSASTYKLPLNLYFYDMQRRGEITGDTVITWTNRTLDEIHEESLVHSNNELSEALIYYWGDFRTYKENMRTYFTMTDEEIPPIYYDESRGNFFCVRMMMDCLKVLYDHREDYAEAIDYLKQAMPGQYFKRGVTEYEVAHKYGYLDVCQNDVGIIYAPQPILLAVYTEGIYGETLCGEAARLLTDYTVWKMDREPEAPTKTEELTVTEVPLPEPLPKQPEEKEEQKETVPPEPAHLPEPEPETVSSQSGWIIPAALAAGLLLLWWVLHRRRKRS